MYILALLAYPFFEVYLFILACRSMGWENTVLLTLATSFVGLMLLRVQRSRQIFDRNNFTPDSIENYLFTNLGLFALILPGFISDLFGITVIFPPSRHALLKILRWLHFDLYGRSTGPFSVFRTYSFGSERPTPRDSDESSDYATSYETANDADDISDDAIDVEFTVRD